MRYLAYLPGKYLPRDMVRRKGGGKEARGPCASDKTTNNSDKFKAEKAGRRKEGEAGQGGGVQWKRSGRGEGKSGEERGGETRTSHSQPLKYSATGV